ncbi:ABC transporter family substrate-binding protein [Nocardia cyriacigeorgica]|uniref:Probable monoacyl phosphatidylinositol tetramannoside-binding protein LpqW n=1 Tax=Nocardia cyriacigeorgica TaxID=135487 RepID=A0A4U8W3L1_9NOCA|nr:ABC transporter family substrate-binding protein [Nocardia cyriacigeorgica]MBF6101022.1 ABC transporter family substrate-binding protein [Nocardia cyriacigeorgica]MBF6315440.1 ABC transporter family substrate-binding protein [Nocardia cyriacigeorgica]MBF6530226.1 ABC transporter family substrate-binding protein [Nocardia cyriacigeorgica]VFB00647.1 Probable monoacyl phosphatidylinositol tetramannoside-binding protein LpqW precursor [Nocardia cyriacigeorgica]
MRVRTAPGRWALAVLALGLIATGCAANDTTTGGTSTLGTTSDINPRGRDEVRDGGNLRLAITAFPANWNTLSIDGHEAEIGEIEEPMMPRAFSTDAAGRLSINTDYFTDVALTNTNPQQVTYTINPEAVWSDGSPITWEDIASQAHALSGRDKRFMIAINNGFDRVAKVERGVDDRQAILTFDRHYAEWRGQFAGNSALFPKSVTADPETFNTGLRDGITLTAGPFLVRSTDRAVGRIVLGRNPKWWGEQPKLDTITYSVLDRAAWVGALQNNELDAAMLSSIDDVTTVRQTPGVVIRRAPGNRWRHITFNGAPGSILEDARVRVAISKAIDRKAIAAITQNGLVDDPQPLNNHIYLQGQEGYRDNSLGFDPEAAARELDALGWTRSGDVREKDGRKLVIRDVMYDDDLWVQIAQIIQQNLAAIGVQLVIDTRPGAGYFTDVIQPGDFDAAQFIFEGDAFPLSSIPQIYGYYPDNLQANFGRIGSPELNDLIERTLSELDPAKAIELANQVDRMVFEEGHSLPLTQSDGSYGVRAEVANFGSPGLASYDYTKIGFVK